MIGSKRVCELRSCDADGAGQACGGDTASPLIMLAAERISKAVFIMTSPVGQ